jgi:hypothetical protein
MYFSPFYFDKKNIHLFWRGLFAFLNAFNQARLEVGSTCSKNTGAEGTATVNRAPNAKGKGAKREMNTVKFWLEPALPLINLQK